MKLKRLEHPFWEWYENNEYRQGTPVPLRELNAPGASATVPIEAHQEPEILKYLQRLGFSAVDRLPVEFVGSAPR